MLCCHSDLCASVSTVWERRRQREQREREGEGERLSSSDTCSLSISLHLSLDTRVFAGRRRATLLLLCDGETAGKFFSSYDEAWSMWRYVHLCYAFSLLSGTFHQLSWAGVCLLAPKWRESRLVGEGGVGEGGGGSCCFVLDVFEKKYLLLNAEVHHQLCSCRATNK